MGIFSKPLLRSQHKREDMPEGLWSKCPECAAMVHTLELKQNLQVCPPCGHHFLMDSIDRIFLLADPRSFEETEAELFSANPLGFSGYEEKIDGLRSRTKMNDAVVTGKLTISGKPAMIAVMDFKFFAGSMGSVVGEKITRAIETAIQEKRGMIIVSASSGARMQRTGALLLNVYSWSFCRRREKTKRIKAVQTKAKRCKAKQSNAKQRK